MSPSRPGATIRQKAALERSELLLGKPACPPFRYGAQLLHTSVLLLGPQPVCNEAAVKGPEGSGRGGNTCSCVNGSRCCLLSTFLSPHFPFSPSGTEHAASRFCFVLFFLPRVLGRTETNHEVRRVRMGSGRQRDCRARELFLQALLFSCICS